MRFNLKYNHYTRLGNIGIILTRNGLIMIDATDIRLCQRYHWCIDKKSGYCVTQTGGKKQYMHRLVMGNPAGEQVDHINGCKSDNRRCNLRIASPSLNQLNRQRANTNSKSQTIGVRWRPDIKKWEASITFNGQYRYLGVYRNKIEAVIIRGIELERILETFFHTRLPQDLGA